MLWILLPVASAASHVVRLHGGLSGLAGPNPGAQSGYHGTSSAEPFTADGPSFGGGLLGRVTVHGERFAFDTQAREILSVQDTRLVGALFIGGRYTPESPLHLRLGFAHNHETPIDVFLDTPGAAVFGTADGIRHRSGVELGVGASTGLSEQWGFLGALRERMGFEADLSLAWLPDHKGPHTYVYLDLTGSIGLGPGR
jgi:hypothetical protein